MNSQNAAPNSSRAQLADWWAGVRPLVRRGGPRVAACACVLAALWIAGAWFNGRHETLKPAISLAPIDLKAYVNRGVDIPKEQNAAWAYLDAEAQLQKKEKLWKSDIAEAGRLHSILHDARKKLNEGDWQRLAAFAEETNDLTARMRAEARRPQCVYPLNQDRNHGGRWDYITWRAPRTLAQCLGLRAHDAAHRGGAQAWGQAMDDLLGLIESMEDENAPAMVELRRNALVDVVAALAAACSTGAASDDALLAGLDRRLEALRPLDAMEPLMAFALAIMNSNDDLNYYGTYPRYLPGWVRTGERLGPVELDAPNRIGGFAARDRALCAAYFNDALAAVRTRPAHEVFTWMLGNMGDGRFDNPGLALAPRYAALSWDTAYGLRWGGAPGACFASLAEIRLARSLIALMRQGRDAQGVFRAKEPEMLRELLKPFPNPFTGRDIDAKIGTTGCELAYAFGRNRFLGDRLNDRYGVTVTLPVPGMPGV